MHDGRCMTNENRTSLSNVLKLETQGLMVSISNQGPSRGREHEDCTVLDPDVPPLGCQTIRFVACQCDVSLSMELGIIGFRG